MIDPEHRRDWIAAGGSLLLHGLMLVALLQPLADPVPPQADPLEVTLVQPPPPKKKPGGSPAPSLAPPRQVTVAAAQPVIRRPVPEIRVPSLLPPPPVPTASTVRETQMAGSGVGQGGVGTGAGRGIGSGTEDDYVARLRRHFDRNSRNVEAPANAPRYVEVKVDALIDQTGLLLRAELRDSSGYRQVDQEVLRQLNDMSPFPPPPPELHPPFRITMPLAFQTERG